MPDGLICDLCKRAIPAYGHYIVRIEVFADPSLPPVKSDELGETDFDQAMKDLMEEMKDMTADDLLDQVHRWFEYTLCRSCHAKFLANPLGKPRQMRAGNN